MERKKKHKYFLNKTYFNGFSAGIRYYNFYALQSTFFPLLSLGVHGWVEKTFNCIIFFNSRWKLPLSTTLKWYDVVIDKVANIKA